MSQSASSPVAVGPAARGRPNSSKTDYLLLAGRVGLVGAALGSIAGLVELTIGPSIRSWVGDKSDTTGLGITTTALSAVVRHPVDEGRAS